MERYSLQEGLDSLPWLGVLSTHLHRISSAENGRSMILAARSRFSQAAIMCAASTGVYNTRLKP